MHRSREGKVLECRHLWYEFVEALEKAGVRVKSACFEERQTDKMALDLCVFVEVIDCDPPMAQAEG